METSEGLRHHARFVVRWPVLYGNDELCGQGTMLNVSQVACQLAGNMLVSTGMVLKLWVAPSHKANEICVEEARVLWVRDHEFAIELRRLPTEDCQWLMGYLEHAERRNSFCRATGIAGSKRDLAAMPLALPLKD